MTPNRLETSHDLTERPYRLTHDKNNFLRYLSYD